MLDKNDPWVCQEEDDDDYVVDRFELRVRGKKPLVLNAPTFSKLVFVTQQYLHCSLDTAKSLLKIAIIDAPDPLTAQEHCRLVMALERHLGHRSSSER